MIITHVYTRIILLPINVHTGIKRSTTTIIHYLRRGRNTKKETTTTEEY